MTILSRILLLLLALTVSFFAAVPFEYFNDTILGFQKPVGFFGFTIADGILAWTLSFMFWSGVVFGTFGKRIDYTFIALVALFAFWIYSSTENVTSAMYLGLFGVALLGNAIGYMLKLARLRWVGR